MPTRITLALTQFLSPIENSLSSLPNSQSESQHFKRSQKQPQEAPQPDAKSKTEKEIATQSVESRQPKLAFVPSPPKPEAKPTDPDIFVQLNSMFKSLAPKTSKQSVAQVYKVATRGQMAATKTQKGIIFDKTSNEKIE